jgi:hypothetical protein
MDVPQKNLKIELSCDPAVPLWSNLKSAYNRDTAHPCYIIAVIFTD